jgi:hypothetical protein
MSERLSEYFWMHELTRSPLAARHRIDNRVNDAEIIARARGLARNVLEPIREAFGAYSPTSWYRCEKLEQLLCSDHCRHWGRERGLFPDKPFHDIWPRYFRTKQHPLGAAGDLDLPYCSPEALYRWIADRLDFDQLILEGEPGNSWVHVSWVQVGNRHQMREIPNP